MRQTEWWSIDQVNNVNTIFSSAGYDDERALLMSQKSLEKRFGQSPVFIAATFMEQGGIPTSTNPTTLLKEAIHVISCGYEDKTEWGKEVSGTIRPSI